MTDVIELDENGYVLETVKAWRRHGVYPPPMIGNPNNPEVVAMAKAHRARIAQLSPEEQERQFEAERQFMTEFLVGFKPVPRRTAPSKS